MNLYKQLSDKHQSEVNDFLSRYAFFAFSPEQFKEGLARFGISEADAPDKLQEIGAGGFILKDHYNEYNELAERLNNEFQEALRDPETGHQFAVDMFTYELANHEYCYTGDVSETLDALGLEFNDVVSDPVLSSALLEAIQTVTREDNSDDE